MTNQDQGWTRFRGPNGSGISTGYRLPESRSASRVTSSGEHPVRPGKSSPVLTARHVFLTGYDKEKLITQCFDRATGRLVVGAR